MILLALINTTGRHYHTDKVNAIKHIVSPIDDFVCLSKNYQFIDILKFHCTIPLSDTCSVIAVLKLTVFYAADN